MSGHDQPSPYDTGQGNAVLTMPSSAPTPALTPEVTPVVTAAAATSTSVKPPVAPPATAGTKATTAATAALVAVSPSPTVQVAAPAVAAATTMSLMAPAATSTPAAVAATSTGGRYPGTRSYAAVVQGPATANQAPPKAQKSPVGTLAPQLAHTRGKRSGNKNNQTASASKVAGKAALSSASPASSGTKMAARSNAGAERLRASLLSLDQQSADSEDEVQLKLHYECARSSYQLRQDGHQRLMTELETETLRLWATRRIHLTKPPRFIRETHVGMERDVFTSFHREHLGFKLYSLLPVGTILPATSTKWHFCHRLIQAAAESNNEDISESAARLLATARFIRCTPKAQMVEFVFVRPETQAAWANRTLPFANGSITLRATDSLANPEQQLGYDAAAEDLLYQILCIGRQDLNTRDIRAIMESFGAVVLEVEEEEPIGVDDCNPHVTRVTFDLTICPQQLENIRRLSLASGTGNSYLLLQHTRVSSKPPCLECLSLFHFRRDCKASNAVELAAKHTKKCTVPPYRLDFDFKPIAQDKPFKKQLTKMRKLAAPALDKKHKDEKAAQQIKDNKISARLIAVAAAQAARLRTAAQPNNDQGVPGSARALREQRRLLHERVTDELKMVQSAAAGLHTAHPKLRVKPSTPATPAASRRASGKLTRVAALTAEELQAAAAVTVAVAAFSAAAHALSNQPNVSSDPKLIATSAFGAPSRAGPDATQNQPASAPATPPKPFSPQQGSHDAAAPLPAEDTTTTLALGCAPYPINVSPANDMEMEYDEFEAEARVAATIAHLPSPATSLVSAPVQSPVYSPAASLGKRARAGTTAEDLSNDVKGGVGCLLRPPTRQARANTLHQSVSRNFNVDGTAQLKAREDDTLNRASQTPRRLSLPKTQLQLTVQHFFTHRPARTRAADKDVEMYEETKDSSPPPTRPPDNSASPDLIPGLAVAPNSSPKGLAEWLAALEAHEVRTPGNGSCFYFAIHAVKTAACGKVIRIVKSHLHEANYYRKAINSVLGENLEELATQGSINLADMHRRHRPGSPVNGDTVMIDLQEYLVSAAVHSCATTTALNHWAGTEEIIAAVLFLREPLYIMDLTPCGQVFVQMHLIEPAEPRVAGSPEVVKTRVLSAERAHFLIQTMLSNKVIPLVLLLRHGIGPGGGHFTGLRFPKRCYATWCILDDSRKTMKERLVRVLERLQLPIPRAQAPRDFYHSGRPASIHSEYLPSSQFTWIDSRQELVGDGAFTDSQPEDCITRRLEADFGSAGPLAGISGIEVTSPRASRTSDADHSNPKEAALTPITHRESDTLGLDKQEHDSDFDWEVTRAIRSRAPRAAPSRIPAAIYHEMLECVDLTHSPSSEARQGRELAPKGNLFAFEGWKRQQTKLRQATLNPRSAPDQILAALQVLKGETVSFIGLMHALPYPEVILALLQPSILRAVGRDVIYRGLLFKIERYLLDSKATDVDARRTLLEWQAALLTGPLNLRWALVQSKDWWAKARFHVSSSFEGRNIFGVEDEERCLALAVLLASSGHLPSPWHSLPLEQQCEALLRWSVEPSNQAGVRQLLVELRNHNWSSVATLLHQDGPTSPAADPPDGREAVSADRS